MQVILLQDEKKLGKKGEIVKVSDGYARNYVIPKKIGAEVTPQSLNEWKVQQKIAEKQAQDLLSAAQELASRIGASTVEVKMKAGEGGRVFGSVSSKEIVTELKKQFGYEVDKKKIQLPEPIRTFGYTDLTVRLHPEVSATLRVHVTEE